MTGCFTVWISKKLNHSTYQFLLQIHIQYDEDVCRFTDFILLNLKKKTTTPTSHFLSYDRRVFAHVTSTPLSRSSASRFFAAGQVPKPK